MWYTHTAVPKPGQGPARHTRAWPDRGRFTRSAPGRRSARYPAGVKTGYRLAQLHPRPEPGPVAAPLTRSTVPAAVLSLAEAKERLDLTGQPFLFFADPATGHGNVLYHRYDGHYGLITPADARPRVRSGAGS